MNRLSWLDAGGDENVPAVLWELGECSYYRIRRVGADGTLHNRIAVLPAERHPTQGSVNRLTHEYALRDHLDGAWALRPLELVRERGQTALVLEYQDGVPADRLISPSMEIGRFLRLAATLSGALSQLHRQGLIHKDIKPPNVLVNPTTHQVWLTGFGIATRLPRERQVPNPPEFIAGTLAYMAPEQTGRMNRSVDSRSDLYSLGVTLYELLTGSPPFTAADPMEWVHCHIARQPAPPTERRKNVPPLVSAIVMKLLAKTAEERYQTAVGAESDLRRCLAEWEAWRRTGDFALGEQDIPDRLMIPEKLYGRDRQVETLLTAFDRIVAGGKPELVLVSGYSGIGKSAVVNELHRPLVPPRGLFASGKFDRYKRDIPYATLAQAFQSLIRPLLSKSEGELRQWREALHEALDPNGLLMVELVPELKHIIGEQPPVPELPPQDAQGRFQLIFRRFIGVFACPAHPLALFLDDLQWLDAATLDLVDDLLSRTDIKHLLLIGAYRDNEVSPTHPLMRKLDAMRRAGSALQDIVLAPLAGEDLGQLLADSLRCEPERAAPLAELVLEKTSGNPFFAIQFIATLADEGLLAFDYNEARWIWDLNRIHAVGYTDNVVDLMVGKLSRLPSDTRQALQQFACLGNSAGFDMLQMVYQESVDEMHGQLWEAVRSGLICRLEDSYRFLHDRVQEAAYTLIPKELRAQAHLRIGTLLAQNTPRERLDEDIFEIVNQLNRGARLIESAGERAQVAALNLIAGKRAKLSTAYASALNYLNAGRSVLSDTTWDQDYDRIFALECLTAECELLTAKMVAAEKRLAMLTTRARTRHDFAVVTRLQLTLYTTLDRSELAIEVFLDYLRRSGTDWSPHPTREDVMEEYDRIWSLVGNRQIEDLADLPLLTDRDVSDMLDVFTEIVHPAMFYDENLSSLAVCRMVNLSLEHGNCDGSCFGYVWFAMFAGPRFDNYKDGFRFGQLGYDLVAKGRFPRHQARTYITFSTLMPWAKHAADARELVLRAYDVACQTGDLTYSAYGWHVLITNQLTVGDPLKVVQGEAEKGLAFATKQGFGLVVANCEAHLGLIRTLRGLTRSFGCFDDDNYNEAGAESHYAGNPVLVLSEFFYWTRKLQGRFIAGDYTAAVNAAERAHRILWTAASQVETGDFRFYAALAHAAAWNSAPAEEKQRHLDTLIEHDQQLRIWADHCPANFENRATLVGAEIARIEGRMLDAEHLYDMAIRSSNANGFIHHEAVANELAAQFYEARGLATIARAYLQDARSCYRHWGADGKVRQLEQLYPDLGEERRATAAARPLLPSVEQLDLATVLKVSQAIAGEIVLEKLIDTILHTAIEQAGAERGLLILPRDAEYRIEAEATTVDDDVKVSLRESRVTAAELPESVFQYVIRTKESVLLHDATAKSPFGADGYLQRRHTRSMLCLPLLKQSKLLGVLYLENSLTTHVFTPARMGVLKLLASQAAISIENTRLYRELQERESRVRRLFNSNIIGIFTWNLDGRILDANEAFLRIIGYGSDDLLSGQMRWKNLMPPEWDTSNDQIMRELLATGVASPFEGVYIKKDGRRAPVLIGAALFEGAPTEGVAFVLDLSERKRAESDLRRAHDSLAEAQRLSKTGSFTIDLLAEDHNWSEEAFRIFAFDPATKITVQRVRDTIHADDLASFDTALTHRTSGGNVGLAFRIVTTQGAVKHVRGVAHVIEQVEGQPKLIGTLQDVTDGIVAEEALNRARSELAHVSRVSTLGMLAASIAHEVSQPLSGIIANASTCLRLLAADPPKIDAARETARRTIRDGNRAAEVVARLRTLFGKKDVTMEPVDLNDATREVIALMASELQKSRAMLRTTLTDDLPVVIGDRVQLQQVILNLLLNACDAMSSVEDRPRQLVINTEQSADGQVCLAVQDSGVGFESQSADKLFEAFYTTKKSGMGMGLSVSRSIIESHHGKLWAAQNDGPGATFAFSIPRGPECAEDAP